jgi:predicted  nucleic acid-binding Zn-ribbon protein
MKGRDVARHWGTADADAASETGYEDTISLLQQEIERLENELAVLRDEAATRGELDATIPLRRDRDEIEPADDPKLEELRGELAERDAMVVFLLDQVRLMEEAEVAQRAEWEQLNRWVAEVEKRVESRDRDDGTIEAELESARLEADAARRESEAARRAWEARKRALEDEVERLRSHLAELASDATGSARASEALDGEIDKLRTELAAAIDRAANAETLLEELDRVRANLDETRQSLAAAHDEIDRVRIEHQAEVASIRAARAIDALAAKPVEINGSNADSDEGSERLLNDPNGERDRALAHNMTSVDERIRAFRQHLREVHDQETVERKNRGLSARLSRLWSRSGPRG